MNNKKDNRLIARVTNWGEFSEQASEVVLFDSITKEQALRIAARAQGVNSFLYYADLATQGDRCTIVLIFRGVILESITALKKDCDWLLKKNSLGETKLGFILSEGAVNCVLDDLEKSIPED